MRGLVLVLAAVACVDRTASGSGDTRPPPPATFTFTVDVAGSGTVSFSGESCNSHCVVQFPAGALHLEAAPSAGWHFASWSSSCPTASCDLTLAADLALTATFAQDGVAPPPALTHLLSVAVSGNGRVVSSPGGIDCPGACSSSFSDGANVLLTATPAAGAKLGGFSGTCAGQTCALTLTGDAAVTATFEAVSHILTVTVSGAGTVTSTPPGIICPGACSAPFAEGTGVALSARPGAGMDFGGFAGACTGASCSLKLVADAAVTAAFSVQDECAGLMPAALPPPIIPRLDCAFACDSGTSDDGAGNFLLHAAGPTTSSGTYQFVQVTGGTATVKSQASAAGSPVNFGFSEPSGFSLALLFSQPVIETFTAGGSLVSSVTAGNGPTRFAVVPAPSGGFAALIESTDAGDPAGSQITTFRRFDKAGRALTDELMVARADAFTDLGGSGMTLAGNTLAVYSRFDDGGTQSASGVWIDADGRAMTSSFPTHPRSNPTFQFLADGGLLERDNGQFTGVWRDGATQESLLPTWLQARFFGWWLQPIRGGAAYAMAGTCAGVEVLTTGGKSCGCLAVPGMDFNASVGRDGSLIVPRWDHFELYPLLFH